VREGQYRENQKENPVSLQSERNGVCYKVYQKKFVLKNIRINTMFKRFPSAIKALIINAEILKHNFVSAVILGFLFTFAVFAQQLEIHHIDVGQADATLIKSPTGVTVLIDAGNNGDGTGVVRPYLTSLGITSLNYVVCSHYHADHLGGLDEVITGLGAAKIGAVYDRGADAPLPTTAVYTNYVSAANSTGRRYKATPGIILDLGGGATMKCVATDGDVINYGYVAGSGGSENDLSVGWLLSFGTFQYYTGGDLGGENSSYADAETWLAPQVGDVDVFKVHHHGSAYSTNQTWVNTIKAEVCVIEVGAGNSYGHPVQAVLNRLAVANCYIYQTESGAGSTIPAGKGTVANGTVIVRSPGSSFTVSYGATTNSYPGDGVGGTPLPVTIASFIGNFVSNNSVKLEWQTVSELNNYGFNIQRHNNTTGIYGTIGFIAGHGTTLEPQAYSFIDENVSGNLVYRLEQLDNDGLKSYFGPIMLNPNSVKDEVEPAVFKINQNYPNPFNPSTVINYQLAVDNYTTLKIYNILGKEVTTLVNGNVTAGSHQVTFDGSQLSNGIYFYKLQSGSNVEVKKLTLVK
jgi:beta-lactamase superfamily II metal-dependent hydrolase